MPSPSTTIRTRVTTATAVGAAGLLVAALGAPLAQASDSTPQVSSSRSAAARALAITQTGPEAFSEELTGLPDTDVRATVTPTSAQRKAVPSGTTVRWNRYGTPSSVLNRSGYLSGARAGSKVATARAWLKGHRALLGLSAAQVTGLTLLTDSPLTGSKAHVVRFRQRFGPAVPAIDGMVTLAVAPDGRIAYVSSSLSRSTAAAPAAAITPVQAWTRAVENLRSAKAPSIPVPDVTGLVTKVTSGWTTFTVPGFAQQQQVRLRSLALPGAATRPVFETNVVNSGGGEAAAYTSFVDAVTGQVLVRRNKVDNFSTAQLPATTTSQPFQGTVTATTCGPDHTYTVDAATKTIVVAASTVAPTEDIVLKLVHDGSTVATSDTATSPEAITYSPAGGVAAGDYTVQVCPFPDPTTPIVVGQYAGTFVATEQGAPATPSTYPPRWKYFASNPSMDFTTGNTPSNQVVACWIPATGCTSPPTPLQNLAARGPWDVDQRTGVSTMTTLGNAAFTGEAWANPLAPGGGHQMPVSVNRRYGVDNGVTQDFTDAWNNTRCSPTAFTPLHNNNDILATVTNLFAGHNRFHDFSYFLGFTEDNYNLQTSNFGNQAQGGTVPTGGENDPEIGNVQAGALTGGAPSYLGRDNANQIALQDGIPGITNQYLFQPIAGAFYSPCVDGDLDAPVYGHEYTHATSNRMVAGPDDGLSGLQAGSMGESWSDQVALEYLFEHHYSSGSSNPWVEGPYATGNKVTGIRNYALNTNPLQYGDVGYDTTGAEVHADGEIWSAVMFNVRRQLVAKYNATYPESDKALQLRCADARTPKSPLPADQCPGGRRWIQLIFDSFLLQESETSMVDARDAYLAADKVRFGGKDVAAIWNGFAQTGLGAKASSAGTDDEQPVSDYTSPNATEGTVKLTAAGFDGSSRVPVKGKLYVGDYEARVTPIADTDGSTKLPSTISMVAGTYHFVFQAKGYGLKKFTLTVPAGKTVARDVHMSTNLASATNGATVDGASAGSLNTSKLIDDTEASNWAGVNPTGVSVDTSEATHPFVNVDLAGGRQVVRSVNVSAMLRPSTDTAQDEDPNNPDADSGSRFTALRQFAIETCTDSVTSDCSSTLPAGAAGSPYKRVYTSTANAFDGVAPRPAAPTLLSKTFDIPDTTASHVRLVVLENQCTGQSQFAGEQDDDPTNPTDCTSGSTADESARAAELEVFGFDGKTLPAGDPTVLMTMTGKAVAAPGEQVTYKLTYRNLGPKPAAASDIRIAALPAALQFVSASGRSSYVKASRAVRWELGTVPVGAKRSVTLTTRVAPTATPGSVLLTQAQFAGKYTFSPPAAAVTVVGP